MELRSFLQARKLGAIEKWFIRKEGGPIIPDGFFGKQSVIALALCLAAASLIAGVVNSLNNGVIYLFLALIIYYQSHLGAIIVVMYFTGLLKLSIYVMMVYVWVLVVVLYIGYS